MHVNKRLLILALQSAAVAAPKAPRTVLVEGTSTGYTGDIVATCKAIEARQRAYMPAPTDAHTRTNKSDRKRDRHSRWR